MRRYHSNQSQSIDSHYDSQHSFPGYDMELYPNAESRNMFRNQSDLYGISQRRGTGFRPDESKINQNRHPVPLMQLPLEYGNQLNPYTGGNNRGRGEPNRRLNNDRCSNFVANPRQMYGGGFKKQEVNDLDYNQSPGGHPVVAISGMSSVVMNINHYHEPPLYDDPMKSRYDERVNYPADDVSENRNPRKKGNRKQKMGNINPSLSNASRDGNDIEEPLSEDRVDFNSPGLFQFDDNTSGRGKHRGSRRGSRTSYNTRRGSDEHFHLVRDNEMLCSTESLVSNEGEKRGQRGRRSSRRGSRMSYSARGDPHESFHLIKEHETLHSTESLNDNEDVNRGRRGRQRSGRSSGTNRGRRGSKQLANDNAAEFDSETMGLQDKIDVSPAPCGEFDQRVHMNASRRGRGPRRGNTSNRSRGGRTASATMTSDVDVEIIDEHNNQDDLPDFEKHPIINFDSDHTVRYLLNVHQGSCTIAGIKLKSEIFPDVVTFESMIHSFKYMCVQNFLVFENTAQIDQSIVKVYSAMRSCRGYSSKKGCKNKKCSFLHLCRNYLAQCCFSTNCELSHRFVNDHNVTILTKHNLINFSESQLFDLLRCSSIFACPDHNSEAGCPDGNSCCNMHICKEYILGRCLLPSETCGRDHAIKSDHNSRILRVHKMLNLDESTIFGNVLVTKERRKDFKPRGGECENEISSNITKRASREKGHKENSLALPEDKVSNNALVRNQIQEDFVLPVVDVPIESDTKTVPHGISVDVKEAKVFSPATASIMHSTKSKEPTMGLASSVENVTDQIRAFNLRLEPLIIPVSGSPIKDSEKLNITYTRNSIQATNQDSRAEIKKEFASLDNSAGISMNNTVLVNASHTARVITEDATKQSLSATKSLATSSNIRSDICDVFEIHECFNDAFCHKRHGDLPYLWRIKNDEQWIPLNDLNYDIEKAFCNPSYNERSFRWQNEVLTIIFKPEPMSSNFGEIQRLSTPSYVNIDYRKKIDATHWLWFYNEGNPKTPCWILYGEGNQPPYQDVLEAKFLQSSNQICCFELGDSQYDLDFSSMTQINMKTTFKRSVQRRPVFVESVNTLDMYGSNRVFHFDETKLPKNIRWSPMDTETPLGTELVPLLSNSPQDIEVRGMFHSTMPDKAYPIKRIYRLQNIELWNSYEIKKERMEKQRTDAFLPWRSLFHGTGDFDTVRSICAQGFDQRLHGVNGTVFGKGAYFATTAKYSHSYTKPSPSFQRYMFFVRVMIGQCTLGKGEFKRPPPIDPKQPKLGLYDTCVNDPTNPSIFVIFDNHQAYPEYLIEYHRTADLVEAEAARKRATALYAQSQVASASPAVSTFAPPVQTTPLRSILRNPSVTHDYSSYPNFSYYPPSNQAQSIPPTNVPTTATQHPHPPTTSPPTNPTYTPTTSAPSASTGSSCSVM